MVQHVGERDNCASSQSERGCGGMRATCQTAAGRHFLLFQLLRDFEWWMSHCSVISGIKDEAYGGSSV